MSSFGLTSGLDEEADNVGDDKDLGQPADGHERVALRLDVRDDATEDHVDGGSKEDGRDEEEQRLSNVDAQTVGLVVGEDAHAIAYDFG